MKNYIRLAVAAAAITIQGCSSTGPFSLQETLEAQGYVVIPLRKLPTGHEVVSVTINGSEGLFVLDSGAGASVVHSEYAASFGLTKPVGSGREGTGAGGAIRLNTFAVSAFALNGVPLPVSSVMVTNIGSVVSALKAAAGVDVKGVIGQDVLTKHSGIIDVRGQKLFLLDSLQRAVQPK